MVTDSNRDFSSLPDGVVSHILSLTSPPDICRSSAVSRTFYAAAQSDIVWDGFLPKDWDDFISYWEVRYLSFDVTSHSKKTMFFMYCDRTLLIDDNKKRLALDRWSGKKCLTLGASGLSILGSNHHSYWAWEPHPDSRFPEVAVLLDMWRIVISGKISSSMLSPATTYAAYFVFKMKEEEYQGFNVVPSDATVGIVGGEQSTKSICLDPYLNNPRPRRYMPWMKMSGNMLGLPQPRERTDGWLEIELGEFQNEGGDDEVEISLVETKGNNSKSGLIVHGIEIRPKTSRA